MYYIIGRATHQSPPANQSNQKKFCILLMALMVVLLVLGICSGVFMAAFIGANDCANAMGTTMGCNAMKLWKLILLAAIFEAIGAVFLGSDVTNTISSGLLCFPEGTNRNPISFTLLMLSTLIGSGVWLMAATLLSLPVSTTHSIVGAVIGCGIVMGGFQVVCYKEVLMLGVWWVASPIIGFVVSLIFWFFLKKLVIQSSNPRQRTRIVLPFLTAFTTVVLILFLIYKGAKGVLPKSLNDIWYLWSLIIPASALVFGIIVAVFTWLVVLPWIKRRVEDPQYMNGEQNETSINTKILGFEQQDILDNKSEEQLMNEKSERLSFNVLVVLTSCCIAMAHGSNDIANASGPLSAIIYTYNTGRLPSATTESVKWATWVTSAGLVFGLAALGYKVMKTIGSKIAKITPARAFVTQVSTAFITLTFSAIGVPLSTTHIIVGSVLGISVLDVKHVRELQWKTLLQIVLSWVITIPFAALVSISVFGIGMYIYNQL